MKQFLTEKSWETGDIKCLMGLCCLSDQNLHKVHDKSIQGCIFYQTNLLTYDQSSTQRSFPAVMSNQTHLFCNDTKMFNKLTIQEF